MKLISIKPVSELEIAQVKDILRQSHCPNESLRNTFTRYSTIIGDIIFFDDAQTFSEPFITTDLEEDNHEHSTTAT